MAVILPPYQEDDRMLSGLAYPLWPFICPIIFMGDKKNEPFVHFHAIQALALGVISLAAAIAISIITFLLLWLLPSSFVTFSGFVGLTVFLVLTFAFLFWFSVIIYIAWQASSGKFLHLPFLGKWAEEKMQTNLGITEADYATTMIGEKREVKIDPFDYESALENAAQAGDSYAKSELEALSGPEYTESEVIGDPESIEYSRRGSGDISEYLQPEASSVNATVTNKAPSLTQQPTVSAPARGGFRPLTPQSGRRPVAQSVAPKSQPIVPPIAPVEQNEFKPLATTIAREKTSHPATGGGTGVRFNSDFSTPTPTSANTEMPYRQPQPNRNQSYTSERPYHPGSRPSVGQRSSFTPGLPTRPQVERDPVSQQPPSGEPDFTPGIISRPAVRQSKRTFQWNELDNGQ